MAGTTTRVTKRLVTIVGIGAALTGLLATSASAADTYTVKSGTKTTGTINYTGQSGAIKFTDGDLELGCESGKAIGVATLGTSVASKVANIQSTTWKNCTGPQGLVLVPKQIGTWTVNAVGATSSGTTQGYVGKVNAKVTSQPAGLCNFTVTGAAAGNYSNSTGKLTLVATTTGTNVLKVSGVTGCFGVIKNGDTVGFSASYAIKTSKGKLSIKSN